jgi:hypothetical protein
MGKLLFCALLLLAGAAIAQQPATPANPPAGENSRDAMEPGVDTSSSTAAPPPQTAAPAPANNPVPAAAPNAAAGANKPAARSNAKDRLDLDSSQITGNRELPKVLYIVPWRGAELGDLVGRPVNSLLDEVLEPVDRDVFRRQNRYFEALQPNGNTPAGKPEK